MAKLLGQLIKEDIKNIILWMIMPLVLGAAGLSLYKATALEMMQLFFVASVSVLTFGPLISLAILVDADTKRFYSKKAAFYTSLPYKSEEVTGARLLNYAIMGLIIIMLFVINTMIFIVFTTNDLSFTQLYEQLGKLISALNFKIIGAFLKVTFLMILMGTIFAENLMMSSTLAFSKPFNKMGKVAPFIVFVAIIAIQNLVSVKSLNLIKIKEVSNNSLGMKVNMVDFNGLSYISLVLILIAVISLYFAIINYFHKRKISVQ